MSDRVFVALIDDLVYRDYVKKITIKEVLFGGSMVHGPQRKLTNHKGSAGMMEVTGTRHI